MVHGANSYVERRALWSDLCTIDEPFLCMGDFNVVRSAHVESRIDRALVDQIFMGAWDSVTALLLPRHSPLVVKCVRDSFTGPRPFHFLNMWILFCFYLEHTKLKRLKLILKEWSKMVFGNFTTEMTMVQSNLTNL